MRCPACDTQYPKGTDTCPKDQSPVWETLDEVLLKGPVPLSQTAKIIDQLCVQLSGRHVAGRAYGDLNPERIVLGYLDGELLVKLREIQNSGTPRPHYTPPEWAKGRPSDAAGDIYALGVMLYHLILGRVPFDGATTEAILAQHRTELPGSLDDGLQDVPVPLEELVTEMLAKRPHERPQSVDEVRARIEVLELDSTVMGRGLAAVRDEVLAESNPGSWVDPYGDTLIRGKAAAADDGIDDTQLSLSEPPTEEVRPALSQRKLQLLLLLGIVVLSAAVGAILLALR